MSYLTEPPYRLLVKSISGAYNDFVMNAGGPPNILIVSPTVHSTVPADLFRTYFPGVEVQQLGSAVYEHQQHYFWFGLRDIVAPSFVKGDVYYLDLEPLSPKSSQQYYPTLSQEIASLVDD